jgi:hypothetical protein
MDSGTKPPRDMRRTSFPKPSESVYLDLEQAAPRHSKHNHPQSRHGFRTTKPDAMERQQKLAAPVRPVCYDTRSNNISQQRERPTPILFQDLTDTCSVVTGASQQELLRKKARDDDRHRRRLPPRKRPKDRPYFTLPKFASTKNYYNSTVASESSFKIFKEQELELELSTVESTQSDEQEYPAIQQQPRRAQQPTKARRDSVSWTGQSVASQGSFSSFPILGANRGSFSVTGTYDENSRMDELPPRISDQCRPTSEEQQCSVHFGPANHFNSPQQSKRFASIPWDEREDENRSQSCMNQRESHFSSSVQNYLAKPASINEKPRSILRSSRFSSDGRVSSRSMLPNRTSCKSVSVRDVSSLNITRDRSSSVVSVSPPHGGFANESGTIVSPIRSATLVRLGRELGHPAEKHSERAIAFRKMLAAADDISYYSDPGLELTDDHVCFACRISIRFFLRHVLTFFTDATFTDS